MFSFPLALSFKNYVPFSDLGILDEQTSENLMSYAHDIRHIFGY